MASAGTRTSVEELRDFPAFKDLPDWQIAWFCENGEVVEYTAGEIVAEIGEVATWMGIMLSGDVVWEDQVGGQWIPIGVQEVGVASGLLPYSRMTTFTIRARARKDTRMLTVHKDRFPEMLGVSPEFGRRVVAALSDRVRSQTRYQEQEQKMAALGRLSAGLSHELNNPAAATKRAAAELESRLKQFPDRVSRLMRHDLTRDQICVADTLRARADKRGDVSQMSPLERSEREDEITGWLEDHGVENAWDISDAYVEAGITSNDLEEIASQLPEESIGDVLTWVEGELVAHRMLKEIASSTDRIAAIVGAVKSYSHMDRSPEHKPTDVRQGLDSTLTMLGHKIKEKAIRVQREYADGLPPVPANTGELNQVWTNLLDNAIDAVAEGGTIRIEAARDDGVLVVNVIDDGTGIPEELRSRIFEPFFTTKDVGSGTGLGLDIVRRILTGHQGSISVESQPGRTVMSVRLPIEPDPPDA